ncbi:hypothetical protein SAMN05444487_11046 [Marininema mesophilum]|uniref:Zinc-finger n=1 Tax=Marininema mesophilum TaxID=1048340 RepID=A0A1H2YXS6_9BACL|nr:zf-HC2 domain-containing protein [Marininema mesophilum]SDX09936.1 hypothetical protein SAMN05444487_11046 [Marininema mesophilum]
MDHNCNTDQLLALHVGDLAPEDEKNILHHLSTCPSCQQLLVEMKSWKSSWDFPDTDMENGEEFTHQVMSSLPTNKAPSELLRPPLWRRKVGIIHGLSAFAATVALFFSNSFYWINATWFHYSNMFGSLGQDNHGFFPILQHQVSKFFS